MSSLLGFFFNSLNVRRAFNTFTVASLHFRMNVNVFAMKDKNTETCRNKSNHRDILDLHTGRAFIL